MQYTCKSSTVQLTHQCLPYHEQCCVSATLANLKVQLLLFADDLVLQADSESGLQNSMDILDEFCNTWDLKINTEKNVLFNKLRSQLMTVFK